MDLHPVRVLSCFSGGGGLDLGVALALRTLGATARPVAYVEREAAAIAVLAARMEDGSLPAAPVWSDITTFPGAELAGRVDLVVGGPPCQDISNAGRRAGILRGNRSGLFFEFARVIRDVRPRYVFMENVAALLVRGMDIVLGEFSALGFDAEWTVVSAADTGAPHLRRRVFLLARSVEYAAHLGHERGGDARHGRSGSASADPAVGDADGVGRVEAIGGQPDSGRSAPSGAGVGDTDRAGRQRPELQLQPGRPRRSDPDPARTSAGLGLYPPGPTDAAGWRRVLAHRPDLAPATQPPLRRVADGLAGGLDGDGNPARAARLRIVGNGVVPLAAAHALLALHARFAAPGPRVPVRIAEGRTDQ